MAAQGSASNPSGPGICLRGIYVIRGTFNSNMESHLCLPKPYPRAIILSSFLRSCPSALVTSSGRIHPLGNLLGPPHLLYPLWPGLAQLSSCLLFWTLPSFLLGHRGDFSKMHITFCLDSPPAPSCGG